MAIGGQLVDLVKEDHWIDGARLAHGADHPAGHGPDIGAPVAPDLRLIPDTSQAHPHKLTAQCPGDGGAHRGFPHPWRSHKA